MGRMVLRRIGKCIYCGSTEALSDEHIIPLGLNGAWILEQASCKRPTIPPKHAPLNRRDAGLANAHRPCAGFKV